MTSHFHPNMNDYIKGADFMQNWMILISLYNIIVTNYAMVIQSWMFLVECICCHPKLDVSSGMCLLSSKVGSPCKRIEINQLNYHPYLD